MRKNMYDLLGQLLFLLPPELAHNVSLKALQHGFSPRPKGAKDLRLHQEICGLHFNSPIGLAAGYDKEGRASKALLETGFGFIEIGTVTPQPQPGNPKPRIFRLLADRAVINRMGFNSSGHEVMLKNLQANAAYQGIIGVNLGANKTSQNMIEDYVEGVHKFLPHADYLTINISSPNTPGLRDLQAPENLNALLSWLAAARKAAVEDGIKWRPIFIKLAPDIAPENLEEVISCLKENEVDGIIISNTTLSRENLQDDITAKQAGGLSGRPVFERATQMLAKTYLLTEGKIPLIGVGGIDSASAAIAKIRAGASLIQLYTGLIYQGPGLIGRIEQGLGTHLTEQNAAQISDIVGLDAEQWARR